MVEMAGCVQSDHIIVLGAAGGYMHMKFSMTRLRGREDNAKGGDR